MQSFNFLPRRGKRSFRPTFRSGLYSILIAAAVIGCRSSSQPPAQQPIVAVGPSPERGGYLVRVGGCADCHTPGAQQFGEAVPQALWFTGVPVGWRGPWGTSYASNLRLFVKDMDEPTWTATMRARNTRPPMPWNSLHAMTDADLKSVYQYLRKLGPAGVAMPEGLPPGEEPKGPYIEATPKFPKPA